VKKVLEAAGIAVDEGKVKALVSSLEGVNIDEVIQQAVSVVAPATQEKKEEGKEESKKVEEAVTGLSSLFG
jgi:large subunit ribosomal protein L12